MDLYAENILDHYKHPRMTGAIPHASATHKEVNLSCGDDLEIDVLMKDGKLADVRWRGQGCAISQAAMSLLSEELVGKTEGEVNALEPKNIYELLGVPVGPRRFKCALLSLHTLKNTMRKFEGKEPQSWLETVNVDED